MSRFICVASLILVTLAIPAGAQTTITAGREPGNQTWYFEVSPGWDPAVPRLHEIEIRVSSNPAVQALGADLALQIGDGVSGGPKFYSADLTGLGTVLTGAEPIPAVPMGLGTQRLYAGAGFDIAGPAEANGLLAVIQIDSRSITGDQSWPLTFVDYGGGNHLWDDSGNDVPVNYVAGTVQIYAVPEPSVVVGLMSVAVIAAGLVWRNRRVRRSQRPRFEQSL